MKILVFTFFVFASLILSGQRTVQGQVRDADTGEPLIGAHIYLSGNWRKGTVSADMGRFSLELNEEDLSDSLIISYVGFEEKVLLIENELVVALEALEHASETVIVRAKPLIAEEFQYMKIDRMDIYTNPSAQADPLLAVNMLPSATTIDESANVSLRGSSPFETGVYLNGVPIYDGVRYSQLNGIGTFSIFSPSILKAVDVFPGNPPIELGNSTSGAISMTTDEQIVESAVNSAVVSLANVGFSREQPLGKNHSLKLFSNWQMSGPIKSLNEEALDQIEGFSSTDLGLYYYGKIGTASLKILNYAVEEGYTFRFQHPSFEGPFILGKRRNFTISTMDIPAFGGTIGVQNGLSFSQGTFSYSSSDFDVAKRDLFAGINFQKSMGRFSSKAGFSYDSRQSGVQGTFHTYDFALAKTHPLDTIDVTNRVAAIDFYSYLKFLATDQLTLGVGIRKNIPSAQVPGYLSGQVNAVISQDDWKITVGLGSYHKHGLEENSGAVFRSAARQVSLDIQHATESSLFSVGFFHKHGELQQVPYRATGMEVFAEYQINAKFQTTTTLTYVDATNEGEVYRYDPAYFFRHVLKYSPGRMWEFTTNLLIRQGAMSQAIQQANFRPDLEVFEPVFTGNFERLPDYANLSLGVNKSFPISTKFNVIAFASINNLLDRENLRGYSYNYNYTARSEDLFSQRTVYMGAVLNF